MASARVLRDVPMLSLIYPSPPGLNVSPSLRADCATLIPVDEGIQIVGCSSDHTIVDVTDSGKIWKSGDTLTFKLRYANMLYAFTGNHVQVSYRYDEV